VGLHACIDLDTPQTPSLPPALRAASAATAAEELAFAVVRRQGGGACIRRFGLAQAPESREQIAARGVKQV
jgi:hypothetical protein